MHLAPGCDRVRRRRCSDGECIVLRLLFFAKVGSGMRMVVIGGGLMGTATAYWLARDGHRVTLLERDPELAAESSFANGGMLHVSHSAPWNSPHAIRQLLTWIGREDSPLLLRPAYLPRLLRWGAGFLRNSLPARHLASLRANAALALYSQRLMAEIRQDTGLAYDDARAGIVKLGWSRRELTAATREAALMRELGADFESWDVETLLAREPALLPVASRLAGALYFPHDETGDACLFTRRLGEHGRRLGVEVRTSAPVRWLERRGERIVAVHTDDEAIEADGYVLATGAEAGLLARTLGLRLPVEPVKGYSITVEGRGIEGLPRLPLIDDLHKVVLTPLGARLRMAGTAEFTGFDTSVNPRRVALLLEQLGGLLPAHKEALIAAPRTDWACLRPMTPDGVPIVGPSGIENLWLNVGAGHMGWTFAAGLGRMLADQVAGRATALDAGAYALQRLSL